MKQAHSDIAIIGMSGRLPGAATAEEYWALLSSKGDAIGSVPTDRWNGDRLYAASRTPGKVINREGGFIGDIDQFDGDFFAISPTEAATLDPQQRLLLEWSWQALEEAAIDPASLAGSNTGVFVGASNADYAGLQKRLGVGNGAHALIGGDLSALPNRISYVFDFKGPSLLINTYCSSTLTALHLACQSLQRGESSVALVGAVNLILLPDTAIALSQAGAISPSARCKTFDSTADGYVRSEGGGVFVLKPLVDASADGDPILAVIKGSAVNQDGHSNGITAPNGLAQQSLIKTAHKNAGISPSDINFMECHGTGTPLGDPIEINAIKSVLSPGRDPGNTCWLGAAKANVGHLEPAAGVAGLMKLILMFKHQQMPGQPHLSALNPRIRLQGTGLEVAAEQQEWPSPRGKLRTAGISGFSMGGVNAHVIIQEPPPVPNNMLEETTVTGSQLLTLSAQTPVALTQLARSHAQSLGEQAVLAAHCFTANTGRKQLGCKLALVADNPAAMKAQLLDYVQTGQANQGNTWVGSQMARPPKQVWLFAGQGSQYGGMGEGLYQCQPVFRHTLDHCAKLLEGLVDLPLISLLYGDQQHQLSQTLYTQPALFAVEYSLAKLWQAYGLQPDLLLGHSVGEYVAACIAGVFSLEDALKLVCARGRLMVQHCQPGAMLVVTAQVETIKTLLAQQQSPLCFAAFNGPMLQVLSGPEQALDSMVPVLDQAGISSTRLKVSHAFHSSMMEPMLTAFSKVLEEVSFQAPRIPLISNLSGELADNTIATPGYWLDHIRQPVKFYQSMQQVLCEEDLLILELGPRPVLCGLGQAIDQACSPQTHKRHWLASLKPAVDDVQQLQETLAQLYCAGAHKLALAPLYQGQFLQKVPLPTYPFQHQSYWFCEGRDYAEYIGWNEPVYLNQQVVDRGNQPVSLLGDALSLANSNVSYFNAHIEMEALPFLGDHQIHEHILFPDAGYIDMLLCLAQQLDQGPWQLNHLRIIRPLPWQQSLKLQTCVSKESKVRQVEIWAKVQASKHWSCHATAQLILPEGELLSADFPQLLSDFPSALDIDAHYQWLADLGMHYGSLFRGVQTLSLNGDILQAEVALPEGAVTKLEHQLHPVLLDSSFQAVAALTRSHLETGEVVALASIDRILFNYREAGDAIQCLKVQAVLQHEYSDKGHLCFDLVLSDDRGQAIAHIQKMKAAVVKNARATLPPKSHNKPAEQYPITLELHKTHPQQLPEKIYQYLLVMVARVTKTPAHALDQSGRPFLNRSFVDMGFDSLIAMELRTRVQQDLGVDIPVQSLFDDLRVEQAIEQICQQLQLARLVKPSEAASTVIDKSSGDDAGASATEVLIL